MKKMMLLTLTLFIALLASPLFVSTSEAEGASTNTGGFLSTAGGKESGQIGKFAGEYRMFQYTVEAPTQLKTRDGGSSGQIG
jgi:hypothetical protein